MLAAPRPAWTRSARWRWSRASSASPAGPGSRIVAQQLEFAGRLRAGERLTARVTVRESVPTPDERCSRPRCVAANVRVLAARWSSRCRPSDSSTPGSRPPEVHLRRHDVFARLLARCAARAGQLRGRPSCDADSLMGALEAAKRGLIVPVLVGPPARIRAVAGRRRRSPACASSRPSTIRVGRGGGRARACRRGRDADEGQPAHRRTDARGGGCGHGRLRTARASATCS